jgi:hypothetical protein
MPLLGIITSLVLLAGVGFVLKWMTSQFAVRRHAESLTPEDLNVLEQAAGRLVEEIKETAAVAVRDLDDRCEELRKLLLLADQRIALWSQIASESGVSAPAPRSESDSLEERVHELADAGMRPADIAQHANLPLGEVTLMLSLRSTVRA